MLCYNKSFAETIRDILNIGLMCCPLLQVVVSLLYDPTRPNVDTRVRAALSRDGVEVYGDHVNMKQLETRSILLLVRII